MAEPNHGLKAEDLPSDHVMDPEVEQAARHSDVPDGDMYDTSDVSQTGPGNMPVLMLVLIVVGFLLFVFAYFAIKMR